MSTSVDRMRALMSSLPTKDISLGHKFINNRDFDSLKDLVDSALYKVKKSQSSENPKAIYANINIDDINALKLEVDWYVSQINDEAEDDYDEYDFLEDSEFSEDYY